MTRSSQLLGNEKELLEQNEKDDGNDGRVDLMNGYKMQKKYG
jgi:hypothetical protein